MTGRVHALMPATHLQMSGRSMGTQSSVPEAAASVSSERSTPPRALGMAYLTPTCGATWRRACQVTTPHDDHVCFACDQQALRQQKLVESELSEPSLLPLKMNASLSPNTSPTKLVTFTKKALFFLPQSNASSMIILTLKIGSGPFAPTPSQGSPVKIFSLSQPQRSSGTLASGSPLPFLKKSP